MQAVSQKSRSDHKNGVKSVHLQSVFLLPLILFKRKFLEGCLGYKWQNQRFQAVGILESGMSVSATARQVGASRQTVGLWLHGY